MAIQFGHTVRLDNGTDAIHEPLNSSYTNDTMHIKPSINDACILIHGIPKNASLCNRGGLGISLATPIIMLSFGVLGNIIALVVLFTAKREMRKTVFYTLLFGLAWTDLLGQLMTGPIAIIVYANNLQWVGGEPVCKYHAFCMICFGLITPLFICCMSVERFLALRCPYFHARVVNKTKAKMAVVACWVFVLVFCSLPLLGFGGYEHQFPGSWCFLNLHREGPLDIAYAYSFSLINISVIATIVICNLVVLCTLIKMRKSRKINNSPSMERRNGVRQRSKLKVEEETQMMWFLCAITVVFITCVLPLNIHIVINQITGRVNYAADLIGVRLASLNQILDPWLYILLRKRNIVMGIHLVKRFLTKGHKYESPDRGNPRFVTNHTQSKVSSHPLTDAQELQQYAPEIKVSVNDLTDGSDDNHDTENSESSSCSTSGLIHNGCVTSQDRPRYGRSVSADAVHVDTDVNVTGNGAVNTYVTGNNHEESVSKSGSLLKILKWRPKHRHDTSRVSEQFANGSSV